MTSSLNETVAALIGEAPTTVYDLAGGCVGDVTRLRFANDTTLVAKLDKTGTGGLAVEGRMLNYLNEHSDLVVPKVVAVDASILIMTDLGGSTGARGKGQEEAAHALAALHSVRQEHYGLDFDTRIGGLPQINTQTKSWPEFFRDHRILAMADQALERNQLPQELYKKVQTFATSIDSELSDPRPPSLIHGDVWAGNILAKPKKLHGFIDPAIYYADPEIELAFINLFTTFSAKFFAIYSEVHEIHQDFKERRQHIYNVYPLLVHITLFGGGYIPQLEDHLNRLT